MPEIVQASLDSNTNTTSVCTDARRTFALAVPLPRTGVAPRFPQQAVPARNSNYMIIRLEEGDSSSRHPISDLIEASNLKLRERLYEFINRPVHDVIRTQMPQTYCQYVSLHSEQVESNDRHSSSIFSAIIPVFSRVSDSDALRLRQRGIAKSQLHLAHTSWYQQACQDLQDIYIEASEEGFEAPEASTFEYTRNMLKMLSEQYDELPDIQPMEDRSIAICFENREQDSSILFVIESDCAGLLIARIDGSSYRQRVSDVLQVLPFGGYHAMDKAGIRRIQRPIVGT